MERAGWKNCEVGVTNYSGHKAKGSKVTIELLSSDCNYFDLVTFVSLVAGCLNFGFKAQLYLEI